jgi:hypothetical protein
LGHRLWPHPLGRRELADAARTFAIQPAEDGSVRQGETMLGPQPARQLTKHATKLAGDPSGVGESLGPGHNQQVT